MDSYRSSKPYYLDAIYYKEKFYAIYDRGGCDIIDIDDHETVSQYALPPTTEYYSSDSCYLVESKGKLYLAIRIIGYDGESDNDSDDDDSHGDDDDPDDDDHNDGKDNESDNSDHCDYDSPDDDDIPSCMRYRTVQFRVYKLKEEDVIKKWIRVKNIGDNAFFVGYNSSFSLQASDYFGCCKPNFIYFTADNKPLPWTKPIRHDIGIFNLENGSVDSIFPVDFKPVRPPPFWFTRNV